MRRIPDYLDTCCGCAACSYSCPKQAITMKEDRVGFYYPTVNDKLCVQCGKCIQVCPASKPIDRNKVLQCFAGQCNIKEWLTNASSGGVFTAVAHAFLSSGGLVCGAAMIRNDSGFTIVHRLIHKEADISLLQGSKYVQSNIEHIFSEIKDALDQGKKILFSGTPCQNAAVKRIFENEIDQLFLIDIICHGTPSQKFFNEFITYKQKQENAIIIDYRFRDKLHGWGHKQGHYIEKSNDGTIRTIISSVDDCSYYKLFLNSEISRDCCYSCPYTNISRVGDLTIGDYWGANKFNPELMTKNGGQLDEHKGISCIMINTEKGKQLLNQCGKRINMFPIELNSIIQRNTQLKQPAKHSNIREQVFNAYEKEGYDGVERVFQKYAIKEKNKQKLKKAVKRILPEQLKDFIIHHRPSH